KMALAGWNDYLEHPSDMLVRLYGALTGKMGAHFVTASICYLDLNTGLLRIAGAGHPPAMVARTGGELEFFRPRGKIINDIMPPDYSVTETRLGRGDKLILYTDGITECFGENRNMFGEEEFIALVRGNRELPPGDLCARIMEALRVFVGKGSFKDDITLLVTEFTTDVAEEAAVAEEGSIA
ncbi:MAG TPA: PP2C family protein-serine/threonine phosphatase, partial [Spirochaetota bacterium]|nr:PP2C family protein-serine/threonine phosphatase [Spirochaetota bacterium]